MAKQKTTRKRQTKQAPAPVAAADQAAAELKAARERAKQAQAELKAARLAAKEARLAARAKTRPWACGVVLAKHGLDAKVDDAMAAEVDELVGVAKPGQSKGELRRAAQACRSYEAAKGKR